jgi:hypothetical protein
MTVLPHGNGARSVLDRELLTAARRGVAAEGEILKAHRAGGSSSSR